ncbi:MAG TPA: hypothetical protein VIN04_00280 [Myxococcota bacterium]
MERSQPDDLLRRALATGRVHSAYLLSGPGEAPRAAALRFVRGLVCEARDGGERPCEACAACRRSTPREPVAIDGAGRKGPLYRHVGDHPDLVWVERGADDTRVRIGQVRAVQERLRLRALGEGGHRAAVIADAEWLNQEAQNALLRLLEEPPPRTVLVLVAATASGLLATVRSRCQRVVFPPPPARLGDDPETRALVERLAGAGALGVPELLDWAEEYRGGRAEAAEAVTGLLRTAALWLRERVAARAGAADVQRELDAFAELQACRKALAQRNANPQMVAERALLALHGALR